MANSARKLNSTSWILTFSLGVGLAYGTQGLAYYDSLQKVCTSSGSVNQLLPEISKSVKYFFAHPEAVYNFVDEGGSGFSGFVSGKITSIASRNLCPGVSSESVVSRYNSANSDQRQRYWALFASCLAVHEGAEDWLAGRKMNMFDKTASVPKYVYGAFQLSGEEGGAVQQACVPAWNNSHRKKISTDWEGGSGTEINSQLVTLLGNGDDQEFNIFCGIHELFRGSARPGDSQCLDPFDGRQNIFGPLKNNLSTLNDCVEKYALRAMSTKSIEHMTKAIAAN